MVAKKNDESTCRWGFPNGNKVVLPLIKIKSMHLLLKFSLTFYWLNEIEVTVPELWTWNKRSFEASTFVLLEHDSPVKKPRQSCEMVRNDEGLMQTLPVEGTVNLLRSWLRKHEGAQLKPKKCSPVSTLNCPIQHGRYVNASSFKPLNFEIICM